MALPFFGIEMKTDLFQSCGTAEFYGETTKTVTDFIFLGSRHEIKRCLLPERKAVTNLDSIFKSRDITLPTKVHLVKAMVFPVVMYRRES